MAGDKLKIGTFNVRGLADHHKLRKILHYLHIKEFNIIFLQETHTTKITARKWRTIWGGRAFFSHGSSNSKGVAILIHKNSPVRAEVV